MASMLILLCGCGLEVKSTLAPPRTRTASASTSTVTSINPVNAAANARVNAPARASVQVTASYPNESSPDALSVRDPSTALPRLIAVTDQHDFGRMDPYARGTHTFQIRNAGEGPLLLLDDRSTCKCTASQYPRRPILPGEHADVQVTWEVQANHPNFRQSTTLLTNDPLTPELELVITGEVVIHFAAEPAELNFGDIRPGETPAKSTMIVSQVWDDFEITDVELSLPGATWELQPAPPEILSRLNATSGHRLTVTLPELPRGHFQQSIRFQVQPRSGTDPSPSDAAAEGTAPELSDQELAPEELTRSFQLPIVGKVLRRLAVYGPGVDHTGNVDLGVIETKQGLKQTLFVKVYDAESELSVESIDVTPAWLEVQLKPDAQRGANGLYRLTLTIPPGTKPGRYRGDEAGTLRVRLNHPRIAELNLRLTFAVAAFVTQLP